MLGGTDLFAVLLRGDTVRFIAVLLRGVARVVTVRCEDLITEAKFEETFALGHACAPDGEKNWKMKKDSRVVDKEISMLFVIDTHWEI